MSTRLDCALVAFAVLCAAPCLAQRTWIVDELNRPGTDFLDIPPAVAAAAPGDIIRVRTDDRLPPWYTAPSIDGKGVQILGDPAGRPWVKGAGRSATCLPARRWWLRTSTSARGRSS